jgi:hypothetical protein
MVSPGRVKSVTPLKGYKGLKSEAELNSCRHLFYDAFPDIPSPNLGSGISLIHDVTFSLFNSFNAASQDLSNSQCKF